MITPVLLLRVHAAKEETQCVGLKIFDVLTPGEDRNLIETCTEICFWCCCETVKKWGSINNVNATPWSLVLVQLFPRCPFPLCWLAVKIAMPDCAKSPSINRRPSSLVLSSSEKLIKGCPSMGSSGGN